MKKTLLLMLLVIASILPATAQKVIVNNNSCMDMLVFLWAENGSCGSGTYYSHTHASGTPISVAGGGGNFTYDFGINPVSGFPWDAGTGFPATPEFVKAELASSCTYTFPVQTGCTYPEDYAVVENPNCGGTATTIFETSVSCGTCSPCTPINASFSIVGSDWVIDIW